MIRKWSTKSNTATYPFAQLTTFERTLLSLYKDTKHTYEEVSNIMGYHRDTIWHKQKQVKAKLEELMMSPPNYRFIYEAQTELSLK